MNLLILKYFQVVAQENHITRASQKLNIAQPALSYAITSLEKEMGIQFFDRVGRQIILNDCGKKFLDRVNLILNNWDTACNEIQQYQRGLNRQVMIAVTSLMFSQNLILDFKMDHPDILIKQSMIKSEQIVPALMKDKNDFVLSTIQVEDENITSRFIKEEDLYLLVSKDHPLSGRTGVSLADIAGESFVSLPEGFAFRDFLDAFFRDAGFKHNVVFECFPSQVPELVGLNIGVAFVSGSTVLNGMYPSSVVALPITEPPCKRSLYILWDKTREFTEACRLFYNYVLKSTAT